MRVGFNSIRRFVISPARFSHVNLCGFDKRYAHKNISDAKDQTWLFNKPIQLVAWDLLRIFTDSGSKETILTPQSQSFSSKRGPLAIVALILNHKSIKTETTDLQSHNLRRLGRADSLHKRKQLHDNETFSSLPLTRHSQSLAHAHVDRRPRCAQSAMPLSRAHSVFSGSEYCKALRYRCNCCSKSLSIYLQSRTGSATSAFYNWVTAICAFQVSFWTRVQQSLL